MTETAHIPECQPTAATAFTGQVSPHTQPGPALTFSTPARALGRRGRHWLAVACLALSSLGLSLLGHTPTAQAGGVRLEVQIGGFKTADGEALIGLFVDDETWLKYAKALRVVKVPIKDGQAQTTFEGLEPGVYGVSVIHDQNRNGKMDMAWLPYPHPAEGAGASNNPTALIGPPSWEDSRVRVGAQGGRTVITLQY